MLELSALYYEMGQLEKALMELNDLIRDADFNLARRNRFGIFFDLKKYEEALQDLDWHIDKGILTDDIMVNRGIVLMELSRIAEALDQFRESEEKWKDHSTLVYQALCLFAMGRLEEAEQMFYSARDLRGHEGSVALTYLGVLKGMRGDTNGALLLLNEAIARDPRNKEAYARRAFGRYLLKSPRAHEDLEQAKEIDERYLGTNIPEVFIAMKDGNPVLAVKSLTELIESGGGGSKEYALRGMIRNSLGDTSGAMEDVEKAVKLDPKEAVAHLLYAEVSFTNEKYDVAKREAKHVLSLEQDNAQAWVIIGKVEQQTGRLQSALDAFTNAVRLSDHEGLYSRGTLLVASGQVKEGLVDLRRAGELGDGEAFERISEINGGGTSADQGSNSNGAKMVWRDTLKQAGIRVRAEFEADQKRPVRRFRYLTDASNNFFERHDFPDYENLTAERFYESVKKVTR